MKRVFDGEHCKISALELDFVTNREIKKVNTTFLKHEFETDIITFLYSGKKEGIEGECIISLDSVRKNAKLYETGYKNELKRVIVHGCLHLTGYNDKTESQKKRIREKENLYIGYLQ